MMVRPIEDGQMVFGSVLPQRHCGMGNDYNNFPVHSSL